MWGYLLENRSYNADSTKHKFTGKERDEENLYDYFGARYYDNRIGRWGGVDSLFSRHFDFAPYAYALNNPVRLIDPNGKQVESVFGDPMYHINKETMELQQTILEIEKEINRIQSNVEPAATIVLGYVAKIGVGKITGLNIPFVSIANPGLLTVGGLVLGIVLQTPLKTSTEEEARLKSYQEESNMLLDKFNAMNENATKKVLKKNTKSNNGLDREYKYFIKKAKPLEPIQF